MVVVTTLDPWAVIRSELRCSEVSALLYTIKRVREEERAVRGPPESWGGAGNPRRLLTMTLFLMQKTPVCVCVLEKEGEGGM